MSDPTTVRGWEKAIRDALTPLGSTAVLEELRYISRRFFGFDSTGAELPDEQQPDIHSTLGKLADDVKQLNIRLTWLTGSVPPDPGLFGSDGLPGYLPWSLGQIYGPPGGRFANVAEALEGLNNALFTYLKQYLETRQDGVDYNLADMLYANNKVLKELIWKPDALPVSADIFGYLSAMLRAQQRAADCCEEGLPDGPGLPVAPPNSTLCGPDFSTIAIGTKELNFTPDNDSGLFVVEDLTGQGFQVVEAPWDGALNVNRQFGDPLPVCIQIGVSPDDSASNYLLTIQSYRTSGEIDGAFGSLTLNLPAANGYPATFILNALDDGPAYYTFRVQREPTPGDTFTGPWPKLYLLVPNLS